MRFAGGGEAKRHDLEDKRRTAWAAGLPNSGGAKRRKYRGSETPSREHAKRRVKARPADRTSKRMTAADAGHRGVLSGTSQQSSDLRRRMPGARRPTPHARRQISDAEHRLTERTNSERNHSVSPAVRQFRSSRGLAVPSIASAAFRRFRRSISPSFVVDVVRRSRHGPGLMSPDRKSITIKPFWLIAKSFRMTSGESPGIGSEARIGP